MGFPEHAEAAQCVSAYGSPHTTNESQKSRQIMVLKQIGSMNTFLFKINDFGSLSRGVPRMGFPKHAEAAQWVSRQAKKHANEARQKKHPGSSDSTIFTIEDDFEAISEPLGKASCCTGKAFQRIVQNLINKKMHAQNFTFGGNYRLRCAQPWCVSGARRREKGAQEGGELVISRAKKAKWTYVQ